MSIRMLALDLYKAQRAVDKLQKDLKSAAPGEKEAVAGELRAALKELEILRKMMEGKKADGSSGRKLSRFGGFKL